MQKQPDKLARTAIKWAMTGFPFLAFSYAWIPFAISGSEMDSWIILVIVGESGAMIAGIVSMVFSVAGFRALNAESPDRRLVWRGFGIGMTLLILIIVPNIIGAVFFSR